MGCTSIEPTIRQFFRWFGFFSYRWRWILFIFPLIITPLLSIGFLRLESLKVDDPAYVFTPKDARWRHELNTFSSLWPLDENKFLPGKFFETKRLLDILIQASDHGDILRPHVLEEIELLNQWIMHNISVSTNDDKFNLTYQDLCLSYDWTCVGNEHIMMLKDRVKLGHLIDLTFPRGGNKDTPVYLGTILGNVSMENETIKTVGITRLTYFLKSEQSILQEYSSKFLYSAEKYLKNFKSDSIAITYAHSHSLEQGLEENAKNFTPNFIFSFFSLSCYAITFAFVMKRKPKKGIDWISSKPYVACAGLFTTVLAICSGFGIMLLFGVSYNVINTIIPFLIIAIGIDDMFIMNSCWSQTSKEDPVPQRMSDMLAHAGVAVSITNITDILSFAIGCITELPGIQLFCSYACISVVMCYFYQLTFFVGFLAIMGDLEKNGRHCLFFYKIKDNSKVRPNDVDTIEKKCKKTYDLNIQDCDSTLSSNSSSSVNSENTDTTDLHKFDKQDDSNQFRGIHTIIVVDEIDKIKIANDIFINKQAFPMPIKEQAGNEQNAETLRASAIGYFFGQTFAPLILQKYVKLLTCVVYSVFITFAILGCLNFEEGLNPENLVTKDHYIAKYFHELKKFWVTGQQLNVAVLNSPNFTDPVQREMMMNMLESFENTEFTVGREGTVFFFLEYLNYLDEVNAELENTNRIWHNKLRSWLKFTGGSSQWAEDIKYNKTDGSISKFRFQISMRNIVEPNDHKLAAKKLRYIADQQPFKVEIYHETFPFADQYLIIMPATIRNIIISLVCMSIVAILLVPSLLSCVLIIASIISINIGVFGYMTFWAVRLDAVSMISIIMSIGFAVDLSAHIVYAFITSKGDSEERVMRALESLGWPIFQGATSTIAGISILYLVDSYIILTFFKTIWLTMVIGATHGLLFLPVTLSFIPVEYFHIQENTTL